MDSQWAKSLIHFYLDSFFPLFYCTPFLISTLFLHYVLASAAPNLSPLLLHVHQCLSPPHFLISFHLLLQL